MTCIVVGRTGGVASLGASTAKSEGLETISIVKYLARAGHKPVLFGAYAGDKELIEREGAVVISPDLSGLNEKTPLPEFRERMKGPIAALKALEPKAWINVVGGAYTRSVPREDGFKLLSASVRYTGPVLYMNSILRLPRICVVADPKIYPREFEMNDDDINRPVAVLSQEEAIIPRKVGGRLFNVRAHYAQCEYWMCLDMPDRRDAWTENVPRRWDIGVVANSHFDQPRVDGMRIATWRKILGPCDEQMIKVAIIGHGWEGWEPRWKGVVPTLDDVAAFLGDSFAGPMIPQKKGFATTKIRQKALEGCVPLPYGTGGWLTYDADARVLPLNHPCRIDEDARNKGILSAYAYALEHRAEVLEEVLAKTKPNWSKLDEVIDALPTWQSWGDRFGCYERLD